MVQVDVFWSFAFGAGFASAAMRQLKNQDKPFESKFFVKTLLYLSIFFVPSGATLLWGFPEWETMQVGRYETIPAWLVLLFTLTNVTQGILGYWLAYLLIRKNNFYGAFLLTGLGYFCMFFILVHGWDGTGYQRFFYSCSDWGARQCVQLWAPIGVSWNSALHWLSWLKSPVAVTLYAMGVVMLPVVFYWMSDWIKKGYQLGEVANKKRAEKISRLTIIFILMRLVFIHCLGSAIVASLLIHGFTKLLNSTALGWILGILVFIVLSYFIMIKRLGPWEVNKLTLQK